METINREKHPMLALAGGWVMTVSHAVVLVLSLALIAYISYDTFNAIPFLSNHTYMTFQFWVCVVFLADFFIELVLSENKRKYLHHKWFFFLISIPYLNIINQYNIHFSESALYYIRFVPLLRGAYSLVMVMGFVSKNRSTSLLTQYVTILTTAVYILSLVFFYEEYGVNKNVKSFWDALYWASMYTTTVGCYFPPVTYIGKIISVILPVFGMLILPLFTVFFIDHVKQFYLESTPQFPFRRKKVAGSGEGDATKSAEVSPKSAETLQNTREVLPHSGGSSLQGVPCAQTADAD